MYIIYHHFDKLSDPKSSESEFRVRVKVQTS